LLRARSYFLDKSSTPLRIEDPIFRFFYSGVDVCQEAARRGDLEALVPRTPAEEALISLATRTGYVDWAKDGLEMDSRQEMSNRLPEADDDEIWDETLGSLAGDINIEI